jgi:septal ring factor EnvC (AmiA/AmiB activator)
MFLANAYLPECMKTNFPVIHAAFLLFLLLTFCVSGGCSGIKTESEKLKDEIVDINEENRKLKRELNALKTENANMHMRLAQLNLQISALHNEIQNLQKDLDALKAQSRGNQPGDRKI